MHATLLEPVRTFPGHPTKMKSLTASHPQGGTTNTKTFTTRTSRRRNSGSGWGRLVACWSPSRFSGLRSRRLASMCTGSCRCSRRSRLARAPTLSSRPPSRTSSSRTGRSRHSRSRAIQRCARRSLRRSRCSRGRCTTRLARWGRRRSSRGSRPQWHHSRKS